MWNKRWCSVASLWCLIAWLLPFLIKVITLETARLSVLVQGRTMCWGRTGSLQSALADGISQVIQGVWERCQPVALPPSLVTLCFHLKLMRTFSHFLKKQIISARGMCGCLQGVLVGLSRSGLTERCPAQTGGNSGCWWKQFRFWCPVGTRGHLPPFCRFLL